MFEFITHLLWSQQGVPLLLGENAIVVMRNCVTIMRNCVTIVTFLLSIIIDLGMKVNHGVIFAAFLWQRHAHFWWRHNRCHLKFCFEKKNDFERNKQKRRILGEWGARITLVESSDCSREMHPPPRNCSPGSVEKTPFSIWHFCEWHWMFMKGFPKRGIPCTPLRWMQRMTSSSSGVARSLYAASAMAIVHRLWRIIA